MEPKDGGRSPNCTCTTSPRKTCYLPDDDDALLSLFTGDFGRFNKWAITDTSDPQAGHIPRDWKSLLKSCKLRAFFFSSFAAALRCGPAWSRTNLPNISSDDESPDIKIQSLLDGLFQLLLISNFSEIQFHGRRYRKGNHIFTNSWHAWWIWEWERTDGHISYITFKRESHLCSLVKDTRRGGGEES